MDDEIGRLTQSSHLFNPKVNPYHVILKVSIQFIHLKPLKVYIPRKPLGLRSLKLNFRFPRLSHIELLCLCLKVNSSKLIPLAFLLVGPGILILIFHSFLGDGHYLTSIGSLQGPLPWCFEGFFAFPPPPTSWWLVFVFGFCKFVPPFGNVLFLCPLNLKRDLKFNGMILV